MGDRRWVVGCKWGRKTWERAVGLEKGKGEREKEGWAFFGLERFGP